MVGKWNKSVILTYIGLSFSILGMFILSLGYAVKYAMVCLIFAGVCDMFDGTVARRCKRTEEEKAFGIELDSLVDVISFIMFPLFILFSLKLTEIYYLPVYIMYAIFGVARLAFFNTSLADGSNPVKCYVGLPVTVAAMLFPLGYLLSYIIPGNIFKIVYMVITGLIGILFVTKIKIPKPKLLVSIFLLLLAIVVSSLYLFVL